MAHRAPRDGGGQPSPTARFARPAIVLVAVALAVVAGLIVLIVRDAWTTAPPRSTTSPATSRVATAPATGTAPEPSRGSSPTVPPTAATTTSRPTSNNPRPPTTRSPVPIRTPAEVRPGLVASVAEVEAVEGEARGPGEVAGPAVRFTLRLRNSGDQALPLETTVVSLFYGRDRAPATELTEPGGVPLPSTVAPGAEASGTYVFVVPRAARDQVLITVDHAVDVSLVAFRGPVPR